MNNSQEIPPSAEDEGAPARSKWGRSRFGGSSTTLIVTSLAIGTILALTIAWLISLTKPDYQGPGWLIYVICIFVMLPVTAGATWALLVDRSTLADAPDDPDSSVEAGWYNKAATGAFHTLISALGIGALVFSLVDIDIPTSVLLMIYCGIAAVAFAISYLRAKKADS